MFELIQAAGVGLSLLIAGWCMFATALIALVVVTDGLDSTPEKGAGFVLFWSHMIYGVLCLATLIGLGAIK